MLFSILRPAVKATRSVDTARRYIATSSTPRHLLSVADLTPQELRHLVNQGSKSKLLTKNLSNDPRRPSPTDSTLLAGKTIAMMFNKRSTRTRVSTEAAVVKLGGHPMFLGKDDIQLGVNESVRDTSIIISSMTSAIVARVGEHSEVEELAKYSSVPIINALSATAHPLQTIADFITISEALGVDRLEQYPTGVATKKIAWVGDSNNVCIDLCLGAVKLGFSISVASPAGYTLPAHFVDLIKSSEASPGLFTQTHVPEEAVKNADFVVTDTWISMGQEEESARRLKAFAGYQITEELAKRAGAKPDWKFMHCLPRHQDEVNDEVFYGGRSLVFPEGENRLWAALSTLETFVARKGSFAGE